MRRRFLLAALAALAFAGPAAAQDFPSKPIRLIVPFPPGGPSDFFARVFGQKVTELIGQPVVIENKSGNGGVLGIDAVAKAAPDGYTLGLTNAGAVAISPSFQPMPYDVEKDLALLTLVASVPEVLVVAANVPAGSVKELVGLAKAKPGSINFASAGNGGMPHLAGELFKSANKIDIVHVPYRGAAPAVTDLLSGQVQMLFADTPILLPHIRSGALRALGMASRERSPMLPDLPTVAEAGGGEVEADNWYGLVAPKRIPGPVQEKIVSAARAALASPEVAQKYAEQGARAGSLGGPRAAKEELPVSVEITKLPSGLTVVTDVMPHVETAALGVWAGVGGRDEKPNEHGISHLLEHMAFKGTTRRSAREIVEEIEAVGGDLNAGTSTETTAYYARVMKQDVPLALDVLSDILSDPSFVPDELERKRA